MTLTTITTQFLMQKTQMTITTESLTLSKKLYQIVSGAKNNLRLTMITMES